MKLLLTDPIHAEAHAELARHAQVQTIPRGLDAAAAETWLRAHIDGADALIVRRKLPDTLLHSPHTLKAIVRHGVGLDFIPVAQATRRGIPVARTPLVNANSVAEYAVAAMLAHARGLHRYDRQVREGNWEARSRAGQETFELAGKTVGIVGYGAIGERVAQKARLGLDMRVAAHTRSPGKLPHSVQAMTLAGLFAQSDFIVLACPLTEATRNLVDAKALACATRRPLLINVARGAVVDEAALAQALSSGRLGGAVLDVFAHQPLPADSPLRGLPNVIFTPHLAGVTRESEAAMGMMAVRTALALVAGERPHNVVNPEVFG
ncbi:hydroxyacid dehydrogenase [Orrella sp. JC864]|uniref:hydroxyacid dehydrogenase n=1 Tax=Orrella sp. JC864 TaxID=3120298 RepID=UPI00300A6DAA